MKTLVTALVLASPVTAQTIGGPRNPATHVGGPTPPTNLAVPRPRGTPAPSVAPISKRLAQKPVVVPQPLAPHHERGTVVEPNRLKQPPG